MLELLIALPIFGEVLFCFFIVLPLAAPVFAVMGVMSLIEGEFFTGLFMIAIGVGTAILTWPFAFAVIADIINFMT